MGIQLGKKRRRTAVVGAFFKHGLTSVQRLSDEIEHRRDVAATIRSTFASLQSDVAEGLCAQAIMSCQHSLDELTDVAQSLRVQIEFEDHLWDHLAHVLLSAPGERDIHRQIVNTAIEAIIGATKEQQRIISQRAIETGVRAA